MGNIITAIVCALIGSFLWGLLASAAAPLFFDIGRWITVMLAASILLHLVSMFTQSRRRALCVAVNIAGSNRRN